MPLAQASEQADRRLGKFVITGELGRGGMGVVYKGVDPDLGREVAIKVLWSRGKSGKRFGTEAETAARIRHPNVVQVHEVGQHGGSPYLVMDFVSGETLADRVERDGQLDARSAARITLAIARALEAAHARGVLHRDVKPSNVILSSTGTPQLSDFGLAKDLSGGAPGLSTVGGFLGTPGYAPPEQATGALRQIGPHSDVYALGATLYYALTGRAPIHSDSLAEAVMATCQTPPEAPSNDHPGLDPELERICLRCLEKEPGERYPTATALAAALARWLGERPRSRAWIALAVGVALALGLAIAALTSRPAPPTAQASPLASQPAEPADPALELAERALAAGDPEGALEALTLAKQVDVVEPVRLALAERALSSTPPTAGLLERVNTLPTGTTRDHLRCLAALLTGELEPLLGELRRAPDRYRMRLRAALGLEEQCRQVERLLTRIDGNWRVGEYEGKANLEREGLELFAQAQRLLVDDPLPNALVRPLRARCGPIAARLLADFAEAYSESEQLVEAGQAHLPLCLDEDRDSLQIAIFHLAWESGQVLPAKDLPRGRDPLSLPPLYGYLLYRHTIAGLPRAEALPLCEAIVEVIDSSPVLQSRFSATRTDERIRLIKLCRAEAWSRRERGSAPDPDDPRLTQALALGETLLELSHEEESRTEHALTSLMTGGAAEELREIVRYVDRGAQQLWDRGLILAEVDLREGQLEAAVDRLTQLLEADGPPTHHRADAYSIRAHAHALLGRPQEHAADLQQATVEAQALYSGWIPWRSPDLLPKILKGKAWWPGAE